MRHGRDRVLPDQLAQLRVAEWPPALPGEVVEAALAHVVKNRVEAAYRRTDLFERRRLLMNDWAAYLAGERCGPETGPRR